MASMQGNAYMPKYAAELVANARQLVTPGKGILAADESTGTIGKRVRAACRGRGVGCVPALRRVMGGVRASRRQAASSLAVSRFFFLAFVCCVFWGASVRVARALPAP